MKRLVIYLITLYTFSIPWEGVITIPSVGTISRFLGIILVCLSFVDLAMCKRQKTITLSFRVLIVFVCIAIASSLWTYSDQLTLERNLTYLQLVVMSWIIYQYTDTSDSMNKIVLSYLIGCCIAVASTVWDSIYHFSYYSTQDRYAAAGADPNEQSLILAIGITLAWYLIKCGHYSNKSNKLISLFIPINIIGILLSGSRTGLVCMILALAVIPITASNIKVSNIVTIFILSASLLFGALKYLPESTFERFAETKTEVSTGSFTERGDIWRAGFNSFNHSMWFGVGAGAFRAAVTKYYYKKIVAHNTLLSVLFEQGIVGFTVFSTFMFLIIRDIMLLNPNKRNILIIFFLVWLLGVQMLTFEQSKTTWYVFIILILSGRNNRPKQSIENYHAFLSSRYTNKY